MTIYMHTSPRNRYKVPNLDTFSKTDPFLVAFSYDKTKGLCLLASVPIMRHSFHHRLHTGVGSKVELGRTEVVKDW